MGQIFSIALLTVRGGIRNRFLLSIFSIGILGLFVTQFLASISMRQPLETATTYSLLFIALTGFLTTLFLGINLLSNEIDDRSLTTIICQPIQRWYYLLGKYCGLSILIVLLVSILGICTAIGLETITIQYPNTPATVPWLKLINTLLWFSLSLMLLGAVTIFFTSLATSSLLPFILSILVFVIGHATQPVKTFLESEAGRESFSPGVHYLVNFIYYLVPNFSLFDFKAQAIYNLPLIPQILGLHFIYWLIYTSLLLYCSCWIFSKRDLT